MAEVSDADIAPCDLLRIAGEYRRQNQPQAAFDAAWAAFDLAPDRCAVTAFLAKLLQQYPDRLLMDRRPSYLRLLKDRRVEPDLISTAGWRLILRSHQLTENAGDADFEALSTDFECDGLPLTLLRESPVCFAAAERFLTRLRRWLLLSGQWRRHPQMMGALQTRRHSTGAPGRLRSLERALLCEEEGYPMGAAYLPVRPSKRRIVAADTTDLITRAVTEQYEGWPYPAWTRVTVGKKRRLPDVIQAMAPQLAKGLPVEANMLIAGCGTGRQAAGVGLRYPEATVTAIDVSEASLDYARRQCATLGIANVRFVKLDLHNVADLNQHFHAIHCAGVLHHLPDPERGLRILADVLHPGSVMRVMVYNRCQRLIMSAARTFLIGDLIQEPITDDLLRRVRQEFLEQSGDPAASYVIRRRDFATLAGTHDLLLHRHEDAFDVRRIERALDQAGLRMLSFSMPTPVIAARYDAMFPDDPKHCDLKSWARFELSERSMRNFHYKFWCCVPPNT